MERQQNVLRGRHDVELSLSLLLLRTRVMSNTLNILITKNQEKILEKWLSLRLSFFSKQKQSLIMTQKDQFQNPIRHQLQEGLKDILENFEKKGEKFKEALEQICRILAIQDFPPSKAMALFYELKEIVREFTKKTGVGFNAKDWVEFNSAIETMTLEAFDCYSAHREKIYQLKVDESKNKAFMLLKKAGI